MSRHYNLLELCFSPDLGGLELYMLRCAKALKENFNVISVINTEGKLLPYYDEKEDHFFTLRKRANLFMFKTARALAKIIDENKIDIIHLHWTKDLPVAVMAKMISKHRPKVVQTRNMTMTRFKDDFYHRYLYKHMDMILPVTYQVAEQIQKFIPEDIRPKVEVLYMGSDQPKLLNDNEIDALRKEVGMDQSLAVGMVGRIEEAKGQYLLIDAIGKLVNEGLDAQAFFVGHPMEERYLEKLKSIVKSRGLENRIHFLGFMKNPHHFMQACDVIVLATACETFGLVLIEAMQVGTAVVGTNACGPLEIIDDGKSGMLFKKDDADSLAEKLRRLYDDRVLLSDIAMGGQKKSKMQFDSNKQFNKLIELLLQSVKE